MPRWSPTTRPGSSVSTHTPLAIVSNESGTHFRPFLSLTNIWTRYRSNALPCPALAFQQRSFASPKDANLSENPNAIPECLGALRTTWTYNMMWRPNPDVWVMSSVIVIAQTKLLHDAMPPSSTPTEPSTCIQPGQKNQSRACRPFDRFGLGYDGGRPFRPHEVEWNFARILRKCNYSKIAAVRMNPPPPHKHKSSFKAPHPWPDPTYQTPHPLLLKAARFTTTPPLKTAHFITTTIPAPPTLSPSPFPQKRSLRDRNVSTAW